MKYLSAIVAILMSACALADEYRDAMRRFSITIPSGWHQVSDADVKKFDDAIGQRIPDRNFHYIAAYTKDPKMPLEGTYIIIQETLVRLKGGNYEGLEKTLNAIDMSKITNDTAAKLNDVASNFETDRWVLDRTRNCMMMNISLTDARGQKMKGRCVAHFGEETIIQINAYAPEAKFAKQLLEFNNFDNGFKWDPGAEFTPVPPGSDTVRYALIGGAIGAVIGVLSYLKKKFFE